VAEVDDREALEVVHAARALAVAGHDQSQRAVDVAERLAVLAQGDVGLGLAHPVEELGHAEGRLEAVARGRDHGELPARPHVGRREAGDHRARFHADAAQERLERDRLEGARLAPVVPLDLDDVELLQVVDRERELRHVTVDP